MLRCFTNLIGLAALVLVTAVAGYLIFWHGAHLAAIAPLLLVLLCPLMHLFMHRGPQHHNPSRPSDFGPPSTKEN